MLITDRELKRIVNDPRNLARGRSYFNHNYVKKIQIVPNYGEYIITGTVDNNIYENECRIRVSEENEILGYWCDCFWSNDKSACGHIGAILLKVQELSPDYFPFYYSADEEDSFLKRWAEFQKRQEEALIKSRLDLTRNLIDDFKNTSSRDFALIAQSKQDIEVLIQEDGYAYLKFRVGNQQKYMIRNLITFLDSIENREMVKYGKKLEFIHDRSAFSEDALKIIDLIKSYFLSYERDFHLIVSHNRSELEIHDFNVDQVYQTLQEVLGSNPKLTIGQIDMKIDLEISEEDDYYLLKIDDFDGICGKHDAYFAGENKLLKLELDKQGKAVEFIKWCVSREELYLAKSDIDNFNKYIFNDISQYFNLNRTLPVTNKIENEILTLYGDIENDEYVKFFLESKYDDLTIYSFDHENMATSVNFDLIENYLKEVSDSIDKDNHCVYMDLQAEKTYTFLNEGLPFLKDYCQIMVSDSLQRLGKKSQFTITVGVSVENDLLAIDVDSIDIPKKELMSVLSSYRKKRKFHRLKDGRLLYLESDELEELDGLMDSYHLKPSEFKDGQVNMDIYRAFALDNQADESQHLIFNRSELFKDVVNNFQNVKNQNFPLSNHYQNILRDYQKFGYQWLQLLSHYGFGGVLADDMGLGKTLQIIALLDENRQAGKTSLVVCPSSLLLNWQDEVHKFSNSLTCKCVHGDAKNRKIALKDYGQVDLLITTYDYMRRDFEKYGDLEFEYVILDEAQYIKNPKTKNAMSVKSLKAKHRFALTGTPIENSLAELWSIFDFLMPNYLFNYHYFQSTYETPIVKNKNENKQLQLKKLVSPFILRRNKRDVLTELPEKIEKTLLIEFNPEEEKIYLANLMQVNKQLQEKMQADHVDRIAVLAMLTRLRQLCCEPRLIYDNIHNISSKLAGCLDLIRNFQGNNQKVLLFSSFTSMLDLIGEQLDREGISYYKLVGATKKELRHDLVDRFQHDNTTVFLISLKAGGTGLNLTAAEAVIHFDPWWNISAQNQATDRAYRIGQENMVTVYKLVMKNSVEEKILELQEMKKNLADSFVENNEGTITSMSTDEIIDLFKVN